MRFSACLMTAALVAGCAQGLTDDDSYAGKALQASLDSGEEEGGEGGAESVGGAGGTGASTGAPAATTAATTSTTTTTTGSGGGGACDQHGPCEACLDCATNSACAAELDACFNDADCNALVTCLNDCVDDTCMNGCADAHPSGMNLYMTATECAFCDACATDCAAEGQGFCL